MQSADDNILIKIRKAGRGSLFFTDDFIAYGTAKAVAKALESSHAREFHPHVLTEPCLKLSLHTALLV